jgi:queuine tRNA-ribosyltransferase
LRHLFQAREILAPVLATMHNLYFYQSLMQGIRRALADLRFPAYAAAVLQRWRAGEQARLAEIR